MESYSVDLQALNEAPSLAPRPDGGGMDGGLPRHTAESHSMLMRLVGPFTEHLLYARV